MSIAKSPRNYMYMYTLKNSYCFFGREKSDMFQYFGIVLYTCTLQKIPGEGENQPQVVGNPHACFLTL